MGTIVGVRESEFRSDYGWLRRQLPLAIAVTAAVVLLPPVAVTVLFPGVSLVLGVAMCMALSLAVSRVLAGMWQRLPRSRDILFADLLLWGWIRRVRTERRLACAEKLLAHGADGEVADAAQAHVEELERISAMVELRDGYTHHHSLRVTRHCEAVACELGLPEPEIARVRTAAALHDVGKYYTPRSILNKPDRLTDAEYDVIKRHPGRGAELLQGVVAPDIIAMIRHHHERLNGAGYPDGLVGEEIPLGARIIAVADTFDAMTSNRAYRSARSHRRALDVLCDEAGVALDAQCVDAFKAYYSGRRGVYWSNLFSGIGLAFASARDVLVPSALARALPAIGASAALTVPMLSGAGVGAAGASDEPVPRAAKGPEHAGTPTPAPTPSPTPAATSTPTATPAPGRARGSEASSRKPATGKRATRNRARRARAQEPAATARFKGSRERSPEPGSPKGARKRPLAPAPEPTRPSRPQAPAVSDGSPGAGTAPAPAPASDPQKPKKPKQPKEPKPPKPEPTPEPAKPAKPSKPAKPAHPATPARPAHPPGNPSVDLPEHPHGGPHGQTGDKPHG